MSNSFIFRSFLVLLLFCALTLQVKSNNLVISNVSRGGANRDVISATISWNNSWNVVGVPQNHDAVWLFIKFRQCETSGEWHHALLSTVMTDHSFGSGITYAQPITNQDRLGVAGKHNTGVMIKRNGYGIGDIASQTISLKIVGSSSDTLLKSSLEYDIKLIGIEMVYIPQGSFYVGDGVSTYTLFTSGTNPILPYKITSENAVTIATGQSGYNVTINANFPKGYAAFYCMKYEVSLGQYCDFLNTSSSTVALNRTYNNTGFAYNTTFSTTYTTTQPNRAKAYASIVDLLSYLDWAALRPMTEMEYEKVCRGPLDFIPGEFAWGDATYKEAINISGTISGQEICTDSAANLHWSGSDYYCHGGMFGTSNSGPLEVGVFARDTTLSRNATGAAFYGVMEMSGNLWEICVQVNTNNSSPSQASSYTGIWGDGMLTNIGEYNTPNWGGGEWFIWKGGAWSNNNITYYRISDRYDLNAGSSYYYTRYESTGIRGCR